MFVLERGHEDEGSMKTWRVVSNVSVRSVHEWTHSMTAYSKYPHSQNIHKGWQLFDRQARNPQWTRGKVPPLSVVSMCEILTQRCRQQSPKPKRWKPWHFIGEGLLQCVFARNFDVPDLLCASLKLHTKQGFINPHGKIYPCSKSTYGLILIWTDCFLSLDISKDNHNPMINLWH